MSCTEKSIRTYCEFLVKPALILGSSYLYVRFQKHLPLTSDDIYIITAVNTLFQVGISNHYVGLTDSIQTSMGTRHISSMESYQCISLICIVSYLINYSLVKPASNQASRRLFELSFSSWLIAVTTDFGCHVLIDNCK